MSMGFLKIHGASCCNASGHTKRREDADTDTSIHIRIYMSYMYICNYVLYLKYVLFKKVSCQWSNKITVDNFIYNKHFRHFNSIICASCIYLFIQHWNRHSLELTWNIHHVFESLCKYIFISHTFLFFHTFSVYMWRHFGAPCATFSLDGWSAAEHLGQNHYFRFHCNLFVLIHTVRCYRTHCEHHHHHHQQQQEHHH